ncbi:unnamed protein product [Gadus morhua 'NCC']
MAGIGMESAEEKELDERALPAEPSANSSRPHRERRKPDRYGSLAPEGSISRSSSSREPPSSPDVQSRACSSLTSIVPPFSADRTSSCQESETLRSSS